MAPSTPHRVRGTISSVHREVSRHYNQGNGTRYRSLGCAPCTRPVQSTARNPREIIDELRTGKFSDIAERAARAQDDEDGGLETRRREGCM